MLNLVFFTISLLISYVRFSVELLQALKENRWICFLRRMFAVKSIALCIYGLIWLIFICVGFEKT